MISEDSPCTACDAIGKIDGIDCPVCNGSGFAPASPTDIEVEERENPYLAACPCIRAGHAHPDCRKCGGSGVVISAVARARWHAVMLRYGETMPLLLVPPPDPPTAPMLPSITTAPHRVEITISDTAIRRAVRIAHEVQSADAWPRRLIRLLEEIAAALHIAPLWLMLAASIGAALLSLLLIVIIRRI